MAANGKTTNSDQRLPIKEFLLHQCLY